MGLYHTEDQAMLKDTVAPFLAETAPVKHLRALRDTNDQIGFARDLWKQFAEMGFTGILVPESDGGLGMGHVEAGIVLEEIGRNLTPSPFLTTAVAAVEALKGAGAHLRQEWFPRIVSGDAVTVLPYDPKRDLVLVVEQIRAGPFARGDRQSWQIEAIAGRVDPFETPEQAARREAVEENTGEHFIFTERLHAAADFQPDLAPADVPARTRALADLCLVLFNGNEFTHVE